MTHMNMKIKSGTYSLKLLILVQATKDYVNYIYSNNYMLLFYIMEITLVLLAPSFMKLAVNKPHMKSI
jgi:hypothetical protein